MGNNVPPRLPINVRTLLKQLKVLLNGAKCSRPLVFLSLLLSAGSKSHLHCFFWQWRWDLDPAGGHILVETPKPPFLCVFCLHKTYSWSFFKAYSSSQSRKSSTVCVPSGKRRAGGQYKEGGKETKKNIHGLFYFIFFKKKGSVPTVGGVLPWLCPGVNRFHVCLHSIYCCTGCFHHSVREARLILRYSWNQVWSFTRTTL